MPDESLSVCKGTIADIETEEETALEKPAGRLEQQRLFVELRARGWSLRRCAEAIGVSKSTLATWSHELEAEIASLKAMELEALYEQFYMSKERRIQVFGEQIDSLREELATRDLSRGRSRASRWRGSRTRLVRNWTASRSARSLTRRSSDTRPA